MTFVKYGTNRFSERAQVGLNPNAPGGVETIAELEALNDAALDDGTIVVVLSLNDGFQLDKDSTLVADHITVADTLSGTGRWLRERWASLLWRQQATWYIDAAGDDENTGLTALTPIATHDELMRRWGSEPLTISPTVNLASALTGDIIVTTPTEDGQSITYSGTRTALLSSTLTAVIPYSSAGPTLGTVTDAALPVSWTASGLVDGLLAMTAGASSGAVGWVTYDAGAKAARFSPMLLAGAVVAPTTDTYSVMSLTTITGELSVVADAEVVFSNLKFTKGGTSYLKVQAGSVTFTTCDVGPYTELQVSGRAHDCSFTSCRLDATALLLSEGTLSLSGCYLDDCTPTALGDGELHISLATLGQGAGVGENGVPLTVRDGASCQIETTGEYIVAAQEEATSGGLRCEAGSSATLNGALWGASNGINTIGIYVEAGAVVTYLFGGVLDIDSPIDEVKIDQTIYAFSELPVFDAVADAGVVRCKIALLTIEGMILWLRADLGVATTGLGVSEWLDQSGYEHHATQTVDADRPGYLPAGGFNGLPGVEFVRANSEWMDLIMSAPGPDYTIFVVMNLASASLNQIALCLGEALGNAVFVLPAVNTGAAYVVAGYDGSLIRYFTASQTGEQYLEWHYDGTANTVTGYRDGTLLASGVNTGSIAASGGYLGKHPTLTTYYLNAVISEIIVFDRILLPAELTVVRDYLQDRYGL